MWIDLKWKRFDNLTETTIHLILLLVYGIVGALSKGHRYQLRLYPILTCMYLTSPTHTTALNCRPNATF